MGRHWILVGALALLLATVPMADAARPALPAGAKEIAPGQLPVICGEPGDDGYGPNYGDYYSSTAKTWVVAPRCVPKWGNLAAMPSQIVRAGGTVTMTAVPDEGSNSGTYAPQTQSITWEFPGKRVSGCGSSDLSCTAVPFAKATSEWQWGLFHVTMPRTFFIDSPGSNCAGAHLCAGFGTNAWSFAGVPPAGTAAPLAPGQTLLCVGACGRVSAVAPERLAAGVTALELTVTCGKSGATASDLLASQAGSSCPVTAKSTAQKKQLTEFQKIEEAEARTLAERHQILKAQQEALLDVQQNITTHKVETADKHAEQFQYYIQSNAGSAEVVATLQDADASLAGMFPPQAGAAAASTRAIAVQAGIPDASAVLRSMQSTRPSGADATAYGQALALATSPTASSTRAGARLLLSVALIIGRRVLVHDLGSKSRFTLASASARVSSLGSRRFALRASGLGGPALRLLGIIGLSHKRALTLSVSSLGHSATRTISVR